MSEQSVWLPLLARGAGALGLELSPDQVRSFTLLADELVAWNERAHLTAITDRDEIQTKHFVDSLTAVPTILRRLYGEKGSLVDVGSGGGFPGLPIAIVARELDVTLVEATRKKVAFLEHAIRVLALENARPLWGRAEELARSPAHRERYDFAIARGVGTATTLVELLVPFLRVGGWGVLMKTGPAVETELKDATVALDQLKAEVEAVVPVGVPGLLEDRALIVVRKTQPTGAPYPRRSGIPRRRPL